MADYYRRKIRHRRVRKKVVGTAERPRLAVYFSNCHVAAQLIDDEAGVTLASVHTTEKKVAAEAKGRANGSAAELVGRLIGERSVAQQIKLVVFDRGGRRYHGNVKALADAARGAGLEF